MLNSGVEKYLDNLDREKKPLTDYQGEFSIAQRIKNILAENHNYKPTKEDAAECRAFDFMADHPNGDSGWGTYYGPMMEGKSKTGEPVEYPSIKKVNKETLDYWATRAKETANPILISRYADLVVDLSPKVIGKHADNKLHWLVIDANVAICENIDTDSLERKAKIKRALDLAIQFNNKEKIAEIKKAIMDLEKNIATDSLPGLWGFAFQWFILDYPNKIPLEEKEKGKLVNDLEKKLTRVKASEWLAENAVALLAEHYAREKDEENLMRVLAVLETSLKTSLGKDSSPLIIDNRHSRLLEIYRKYASRFPRAEKARKRLLIEISQLDLDWEKFFKKISMKIEIKKEDVDKFLKQIFGGSGNDKLQMVIGRMAIIVLPKKSHMEESFKSYQTYGPIQFLFNKKIISDDGLPVANLPPLEKDYESHLKAFAGGTHIPLNSLNLIFAIDELKKRFSEREIIKHFNNALLFEDEDKNYLGKAITAYWNNDYLIASHLFIPLIESAIRKLIEICVDSIDSVTTQTKIGGYNYVSLGKLLGNEEIFSKVFSLIGPDVLYYFRLVLTEKLGMNLRNNWAHGLSKRVFWRRDVSDILFHILICLSSVVRSPNIEPKQE